MFFLIIDDDPARYSEFSDLLFKNGDKYLITCDPDLVEEILENMTDHETCVILDHDMPYMNGQEFAKMITRKNRNLPVIISSTTKEPNARENMVSTFEESNMISIINPADHINCEIEWYWWAKGFFAC